MCKCSQENCDLEVSENNDKCILHCEKNDWKKLDERRIQSGKCFDTVALDPYLLGINFFFCLQ